MRSSAERRIRCRARITLTVEVYPDDVWGADCTIEQAHRQGRESGMQTLTGILAKHAPGKVVIVGTPRVDLVTVEED